MKKACKIYEGAILEHSMRGCNQQLGPDEKVSATPGGVEAIDSENE
jgi:hypothetical protein